MKNLIISVLAMQIITGFDFWEFTGNDRLLIGFAMVAVIFVAIFAVECWIKDLRMKSFRAKRFGRMIAEYQAMEEEEREAC